MTNRSRRAKAFLKPILEAMTPRLLYLYRISRLRRDEPEIRLLSRLCRKDALSVDVGANLGLYCHGMLRHSAAVVAFEPLPEMQKTLKTRYGDRIALFPVALSDHDGECQIRFPKGSTSWATVEPQNTLSLAGENAIMAVKVQLRRLDDYKFQNVAVIKIDVEGHEEAVLRGGLQTIGAERPALIIEIEERHNPGAIARVGALLGSLGYNGYFLEKKKLRPIGEFDPKLDQPIQNVGGPGKLGRYINNFIFLPQTRMAGQNALCHAL